jgi:hypothetical protein
VELGEQGVAVGALDLDHAFFERANASAQPLQLGGELLELVARQRQSATGWPQLGAARSDPTLARRVDGARSIPEPTLSHPPGIAQQGDGLGPTPSVQTWPVKSPASSDNFPYGGGGLGRRPSVPYG